MTPSSSKKDDKAENRQRNTMKKLLIERDTQMKNTEKLSPATFIDVKQKNKPFQQAFNLQENIAGRMENTNKYHKYWKQTGKDWGGAELDPKFIDDYLKDLQLVVNQLDLIDGRGTAQVQKPKPKSREEPQEDATDTDEDRDEPNEVLQGRISDLADTVAKMAYDEGMLDEIIDQLKEFKRQKARAGQKKRKRGDC